MSKRKKEPESPVSTGADQADSVPSAPVACLGCEDLDCRFHPPIVSGRVFDPRPTKIALEIEEFIHDRKGIGWRACDEDIQQEIRDGLERVIRKHLEG